jgi:ATP-binding cassette subfamily B protein RaxB
MEIKTDQENAPAGLRQQEIRELGLSRYRSQIAAVMQEDQLMSGTIADNICFFDTQPDHTWIEACAHLACLLPDIQAMPMGFNSLVGDMGTSLSGGQKQRLMLARALYRRPRILFLDEASSHLDVRTEAQVNTHLNQLGITRIVIAHRQATIDMAEKVYLLQGGKLLEQN